LPVPSSSFSVIERRLRIGSARPLRHQITATIIFPLRTAGICQTLQKTWRRDLVHTAAQNALGDCVIPSSHRRN